MHVYTRVPAARTEEAHAVFLVFAVPGAQHDAKVNVITPHLALHNLNAGDDPIARSHLVGHALHVAGRHVQLHRRLTSAFPAPPLAVVIGVVRFGVRQHAPESKPRDCVRLS